MDIGGVLDAVGIVEEREDMVRLGGLADARGRGRVEDDAAAQDRIQRFELELESLEVVFSEMPEAFQKRLPS